MTKHVKTFEFGETVEGFNIPVLNEREIRASAGILFVLMFISILKVIFTGNFILLKFAVIIFLTDLLIRVLINPRLSPSLILGRLIVRNQAPEYVGAPQKKFAWIIGIIFASTILVLVDLVNSYSPISGILCFICLLFLFFETAFGICLGCKVYSLFNKEKARYCPGEVCDNKKKQEIQKTSAAQVLILVGFIVYIFLAVSYLKEDLSKRPVALFEKVKTARSE
ncbi:MAG TPA: DUF4395 domain-containing protein [Bacteroidales bacterium]|nr:DUF4395 domain-containing protein [Bacteroidales bacterium]